MGPRSENLNSLVLPSLVVITSITSTAMKTRDVLVAAAVFSALEAVALNAFAPHLRPAGGVGRLLGRFFIANIILFFLYSILIRPYFVSPLRHIPGPKGGSLIFGHALNARRSKPPGDQFRRWMEEIPNDGLIRFRDSFGHDSVVPTSHATLKAVVTDNTYDYEKQENIRHLAHHPWRWSDLGRRQGAQVPAEAPLAIFPGLGDS